MFNKYRNYLQTKINRWRGRIICEKMEKLIYGRHDIEDRILE
jgi:hypothetical protein